jgi:hypothetical protein
MKHLRGLYAQTFFTLRTQTFFTFRTTYVLSVYTILKRSAAVLQLLDTTLLSVFKLNEQWVITFLTTSTFWHRNFTFKF